VTVTATHAPENGPESFTFVHETSMSIVMDGIDGWARFHLESGKVGPDPGKRAVPDRLGMLRPAALEGEDRVSRPRHSGPGVSNGPGQSGRPLGRGLYQNNAGTEVPADTSSSI